MTLKVWLGTGTRPRPMKVIGVESKMGPEKTWTKASSWDERPALTHWYSRKGVGKEENGLDGLRGPCEVSGIGAKTGGARGDGDEGGGVEWAGDPGGDFEGTAMAEEEKGVAGGGGLVDQAKTSRIN